MTPVFSIKVSWRRPGYRRRYPTYCNSERERIAVTLLRDALAFIVGVSFAGSLMLFTPIWAPKAVFGRPPMEHRTTDDSTPLRFSLLDVACLFVYIGIANLLFRLIQEEYRFFPNARVAMAVLVNGFAILYWLLATRFCNDWRLRKPKQRICVLLGFHPLSCALVANVAVPPVMLISGLELFAAGPLDGLIAYFTNSLMLSAFTMFVVALYLVYYVQIMFVKYINPRASDSG